MNLFENPLVVAKHTAEREMRSAFDRKFAAFWKCPACGGYVAPAGSLFTDEFPYYDMCGPAAVKSGYSTKAWRRLMGVR